MSTKNGKSTGQPYIGHRIDGDLYKILVRKASADGVKIGTAARALLEAGLRALPPLTDAPASQPAAPKPRKSRVPAPKQAASRPAETVVAVPSVQVIERPEDAHRPVPGPARRFPFA